MHSRHNCDPVLDPVRTAKSERACRPSKLISLQLATFRRREFRNPTTGLTSQKGGKNSNLPERRGTKVNSGSCRSAPCTVHLSDLFLEALSSLKPQCPVAVVSNLAVACRILAAGEAHYCSQPVLQAVQLSSWRKGRLST